MDGFGPLIRGWRRARGQSQLQLALEAGVSTRHLSFIENGRARPGREMVTRLSNALDVPLRERNALWIAAGFAPEYRETPLDALEMTDVRGAIELLLQRNEPFPAVCFDRMADVLMANESYLVLSRWLGVESPGVSACRLIPTPRPNLLRTLLLHPGVRRQIGNWAEICSVVVARARRELVRQRDQTVRLELERIVSQSGVDEFALDTDLAARLVVPVEFVFGITRIRFFSTLTTLGTSQDITLDELRIESYHPADPETDAMIRSGGLSEHRS